jgi:predicted ester cyclase
MGHAATNKQVTHFGNDFVTFSNGKIVEHHSADNLSELLQQLGIQSGPAPRGPTP